MGWHKALNMRIRQHSNNMPKTKSGKHHHKATCNTYHPKLFAETNAGQTRTEFQLKLVPFRKCRLPIVPLVDPTLQTILTVGPAKNDFIETFTVSTIMYACML